MVLSNSRRGCARQACALASIEQLDNRLILDAPLALASDGLLLADPTPDELLEPALFADAPSAAASTETDSDAPAADVAPAPADEGGGAGDELRLDMVSSTSCCSQGTFSIGVVKLGDVSEGIPGEPLTNHFRFFANGCGTPPASSVVIGYGFAGSTATKNQDWNGGLASGTVTVYLTTLSNGVNSYGETVVDYSAIDDDLDEPDEFIRVTVSGASANTGATLTTPVPMPPIDALVTSGDYTIKNVLQGTVGGGYENAPPEPLGVDQWGTEIGRDNVGWPTTERSIGVQVYHAGDPKEGVDVTLVRTDSTQGAVVKVLDGAGAEQNSATSRTQRDGVAYFTVRYKLGPAGSMQSFDARLTNAEGNEEDAMIIVRIVD
jgi:hypothetical protein